MTSIILTDKLELKSYRWHLVEHWVWHVAMISVIAVLTLRLFLNYEQTSDKIWKAHKAGLEQGRHEGRK